MTLPFQILKYKEFHFCCAINPGAAIACFLYAQAKARLASCPRLLPAGSLSWTEDMSESPGEIKALFDFLALYFIKLKEDKISTVQF